MQQAEVLRMIRETQEIESDLHQSLDSKISEPENGSSSKQLPEITTQDEQSIVNNILQAINTNSNFQN